LDLAVADPAVLHRLDPVVAELHGGLTLREAGAAAAMRLAVLRLLREQHYASPVFLRVVRLGGFRVSLPPLDSGSLTGVCSTAASGGAGVTAGASSDAASGWTSCGVARSLARGGRRGPPPRPPPAR